ncbi:hypothetical protein CHCC15290_3660 [Bacillus licheniformis]|nr:hypothetical protein CHCC15290_3660 [Bacillus licheniformis]
MKKILSTLALGFVLALGFLAGNLFTSSAEGPQAEKGGTVQSNEVINTFEAGCLTTSSQKPRRQN